MGLIVLPLQCILVNTCMHDQPKKWGRGGAAPGAPCFLPTCSLFNLKPCVSRKPVTTSLSLPSSSRVGHVYMELLKEEMYRQLNNSSLPLSISMLGLRM